MRAPLLATWLRLCALQGLLVGVAVPLAVAIPAEAEAKKKAKAKKKGKPGGRAADDDDEDSAPRRQIKKEEGLAPKKEIDLDADIAKTKDLVPTLVGGAAGKLSPEEKARAATEALMDEKLDEEVELAKKLLELETECDSASPVRFRLADLYWEKSKRAFFRSQDFNTPEPDRNKWTDQMKKLQSVTIKHYQKIADECEGYKDYAKVLFYLGKAMYEVEKPKDGATYFKRIIKEFADSEWVPNAWFMIGEYYFNFANDARKALEAYKKSAEYTKSDVFGFAVYKQGWCYINTGEYELAQARFREVVTISEDRQQALDDKARKSLRKEALRDFVRAYAKSPEREAREAFKEFYKLGGKDSVKTMMEQLGNWYINDGNHDGVIVAFRELIKNYSKSTRVPIYQGRIVDAASRQNDKKVTVQQVKLLTDYFQDVRERIARKEIAPEEKDTVEKDVKEAEDIAENTLRRLALEYHKEAKKLKGPAEERTYRWALDLYKHYLVVFPEPKAGAEVNYVFFMRFYYAEVLYKLEEFLEAARNYDKVVDMNPHPKEEKEKQITLAAAEESVRAYDELVQDLDRKNPPEISGNDPKPIPQIKLDLIKSCERYISYVGSAGDKIVEIRYKMARIYYTYNHFDRAAPAFDDIVKNHPDHSVACYAANLVLDIWNGRKDFKQLKEASRSYVDNKKLACGDEDRQKFAKIEEQSSFFLVKVEFEDKKKYIGAANAYMAFYKDYPKSEYADDAVFNATVNYDLGNRLDKANEVRKFLVEKLPDSPLVPETLYNIAQSYERIVDFENAAQWLDLFAKRYPTDKRSKDAVYNAGLYRATLRDWAGGKTGREKFISLYPTDPEIHQVAFAICESLEEEAGVLEKQKGNDKAARDKWEAAHNCYYNYIKNNAYVKADTDLVCHAQFRRGEIMRTKTDYEKGAQEQKEYILKNWAQWKKGGVEKVPRCAVAVAELLFRDLEPRLKKYRDLMISELNPTDKGKKQFDASLKSKVKERDEVIEKYKSVVEIGVAEWALASLFQIGEAYRDSIQKLVDAPVPDKIPGYKLTPEDKQLLRQQLKEMAAPVEEQAVEAYRLCVGKANELGVYNKWSVKALDQLNKLRPEEYPLVVEKLAAVHFEEKVVVLGNGVVILDGDSFKTPDVILAEGDAPPGATPKAKEAAGKEGKEAAGKEAGKEGAKDASPAKEAGKKPGPTASAKEGGR